jgi:hypothetical protein
MLEVLGQIPLIRHFFLFAGLWVAFLFLMGAVARAQARARRGAGLPPIRRRTYGVNPGTGLPMITPNLDIEGNVRFFGPEDR